MARRDRASSGAPGPKYIGHGIAEWYGALYHDLTDDKRKERLQNPRPDGTRRLCRFAESFPDAAPRRGRVPNFQCSKPGGVCSLRSYFGDRDKIVGFGAISCTCPMRFVENGTAFRQIADSVLGITEFHYVKEVGFLQRVPHAVAFPEKSVGIVPEVVPDEARGEVNVEENGNSATQEDPENVGRIDTLLVDAQNFQNWCAVELQAVYFSGAAMTKDFNAIRDYPTNGNGIPLPAGNRRADFRSSGPKRLLPQLQIKVPTLRRWGKKMVVVVDAPFFNSLGPMENEPHISNSDIVWCVVDYDEARNGEAVLQVRDMVNTTLESAIVGLTAGRPVTKPLFESRIQQKLRT